MRVKKGALVPKKRMVLALLFAFLLAGAAGTALLAYYVSILPRPEALEEIAPRGQTTQLYDRTGKVLLYEIRGEEKRIPVALEDLPPFLPQAVLAAEDGNFYNHFGLDMPGILRAVGVNLRSGAALQGGSTITQQLARSAFLTREKTLDRKLKELILTLDLELRYSKDAILELYLNQVPLGSNVYGVGAASEFYFGKPAQELSLRESATIAAMIRAPSFYSPFHEENAPELEARVAHILATMTSIPPEELAQALQEPLGATPMLTHMKAPHFVFAVLDELEAKYGTEFLRVNGLKVFTTLDWELQKAAEEAVERYAARNRAFNAHNAALVALDPATGELKALVGSLGWFEEPSPAGCSPGLDCVFDPKVNAAAPSHGRQPGSAFKPFVYATAFEKGATAETVVVDEETNFGVWGGKEYVPQNYDGTFRGEVTLRQALAQSLNIPSVKVLMELAGIEESIATAHAMGIRTLQGEYGPSLVLGAGEVRLLELTSAYGVFAAEGKRVPPLSVLRVETATGEELERNFHEGTLVLDPAVARLVTDILSDNEARTPMFGASSSLSIPGYPEVAVKTGTTQEYRDAWALGYLPISSPGGNALVAGVWVGNNNNEAMYRAPGVVVAGPIWNAFMTTALGGES